MVPPPSPSCFRTPPFPSSAKRREGRYAVLVSGGLDSAILVGEAVRQGKIVCPLYLRHGLCWETTELHRLERYLAAIDDARLERLEVIELPVRDLYDSHWSITGRGVPDAASPDEAVFLPGRNVLMLAKAILWCHLRGVPELALGVLGSNPFPDATESFFAGFQELVNQAVGSSVQVRRPFAGLTKTEVMHRGRDLPLGLTFSCIRPVAGRHCGHCNKCAERRKAFADARMPDPTDYHQDPPCIV